MKKKVTKVLTVFLVFTIIISLACNWIARAEEEHIYYSDLFYGYDSSYLMDLTRAKMELYNDDVSYIMTNTFNEYIDSPSFTWTGIKTSISAATSLETFLKLLTDAYGNEHGATYYEGMDAANADFVQELMEQTALSEANTHYGKCGKIAKKSKDLLKIYTEFDKEYDVYQMTSEQIITEYMAILEESGIYESLSIVEIRVYKESLLPNLDKLGESVDFGCKAFEVAGALSMALLIEDVRMDIIDDIMENVSEDSELYKGMSRLKSQLRNGWESYILENYVSDQVMGEICSSMQKAIVSAGDAENYGLVTSVIKVASWVVFDCIMDVPDLEDVYKQIVLRGYYTTLYNALYEKVELLETSGQICGDDIKAFENLFEAYIAMSHVVLEATAGLEISSNEGKSKLFLEKNKKFTYDNHIDEVISTLKEIKKEDRKYKFVENYEINLPAKICQASDVVEDGNCFYMFDDVLQGNVTFTGSGKIDTNTENSQKYVKIKSDTIVNGAVNVGDIYLEIGGNLRVQELLSDGSYTYTSGAINMLDENGYLLVNGDAYFDGCRMTNRSNFLKGTFELKGDLTDVNSESYGWYTSDSFKMIFSGEERQNIHIPLFYNSECSYIGAMTVKGASITTDTGFGILNLCSDMKILGDIEKLHINNWNGYNVTIIGDLLNDYSNTLDNGSELVVKGNLRNTGCLTIADGRVEVGGDLRVQELQGNEGYTYTLGTIDMVDENSYLFVNGDTYFDGGMYPSALEKGILEIKGGLTDIQTYSNGWRMSNVFRVIFSGEEKQNIHIPTFSNEYGYSSIGSMQVIGAGIITDTGFGVLSLGGDLEIQGDTSGVKIENWNGHNLTVKGDFKNCYSNIVKDGSKLHIKGNLQCLEGLDIVDGQVEIDGDLRVQELKSDGSYTYSKYGYINMSDESSYLLVKGDAYFNHCGYYANYISKFTKGILELKGDLTDIQSYSSRSYGWNTDDTFKMIFSGNEYQNIHILSFDNANSYSSIGSIKVTGLGITTDTGIGVLNLTEDLVITGDVNKLEIENWNNNKVKIISPSNFPTWSYPTTYGRLLSKKLTDTAKYDITYQPAETTYSVKFYVDSSLKRTQNQYCANSLVEPYNVTLADNQEFDGWYLDSDLTQKFDIEKDVITSDISLYGRIVNSVTSVMLDKSEIVFDEVGCTGDLKVTVLPSNATIKTVTWTVSDNSIAKVSDTGEVEALSVGSTVIKAKAGNCEAECKVVVKQKDIADVSVEFIADVKYTGKTQEIVPKLASSIRTLIPQEDYEIHYSDDTVNVGTVTVTVNGIGNYCGTQQISYDIVQATPVVNPVLSTEEIFECDSLPTITTSKGDTEGTIAFDKDQKLQVGIYNYAWTFTPDNANYKVVKGTVPITVKAVEVESIYVKTQPDKLDYAVGETFDANGMVVIAKYNNGTEVEVSDYSVDLANVELALGNTEVVVSYVADGTVFTASIAIEVFERLSVNTDLSSVQVRGIYGTVSGNSIDVVLPADADVDVQEEEIAIHTECPYASVEGLQKDAERGSWLFRILAQNREVFADYILTVRKAESEEEYVRSQYQAAESAIGRLDFDGIMQSISKTEDGEAASVNDVMNEILSSINGVPEVEAAGITVTTDDIIMDRYEPAIDGDADNPNGTQGSYSFEVKYEDENFSITSGVVEGVLESVPFTGMTNLEAVTLADALITTNHYALDVLNGDSTQEECVAKIVEQLNEILAAQGLDIVLTKDDISVVAYVAPEKGTLDNPNGKAGNMIFTVAINKGKASCDTEQITVGLPATTIKVYTVSASAGVGGTISPQGITKVEMGDNLTYTTTPSAGYEIKSLLVDGVAVEVTGSYSFKNIQRNHTIVVSFEKELPIEENDDEVLPKVGDLIKDTKNNAVWRITSADTVEFVSLINMKKTKVIIPSVVKIDGVTFKVTAIEKNAFKNNKEVKTVTIGKNVTSIGENAFYKCTALTKITIPSKVKTIGKNAFYGCKKMTSATIGKNVSKIGSNAFYGCSKLKTLKIKTTKLTTKKIGSKAFSKTPKSMKVTIPKKKFKTYKSMLIKKGVNKKAKFKKG